jgi:hypothetical protein
MDSSLACQRRTLKEYYSLRRAGSPSNLSTPALPSEGIESSVVVLNVIHFRTSSIDTAQNAEPLARLCMWGSHGCLKSQIPRSPMFRCQKKLATKSVQTQVAKFCLFCRHMNVVAWTTGHGGKGFMPCVMAGQMDWSIGRHGLIFTFTQ